MKTVIKLLLFTLLVTGFYTYVGQMVPQSEVHPPQNRVIKADMTTDEMVEVGQEIVGGKGTCLGCHTIGTDKPGRFPDLGGIGGRAGSRKPGMSDVDYLAESLYEPNVYIVQGYTPGMPPISKPPIGLSDQEILTVIAYLQSLGGTPTVTMQTHLKYASAASTAAPVAATATAAPIANSAVAPSAAVASAAAPAGTTMAASTASLPSAHELLQKHNCRNCHGLEKSDKPVGPNVGPNFYDVGRRLKPAQIYEAILDPKAVPAKGYPKGVMVAALRGSGFYEKASATEINAMVVFLAAQKGKAGTK